MIAKILFAAWLALLPAQQTVKVPAGARALAEAGEQSANAIQPPEQVLEILGIRPGMIVGEVGAGRGRVTVYAAARVGEKGKVYANDIDAAALEYLRARCRRQGLANVETKTGDADPFSPKQRGSLRDACSSAERGSLLSRHLH
jgi:cyclopropane fatty-acyl-phospholipid synthase-like methyltransferase